MRFVVGLLGGPLALLAATSCFGEHRPEPKTVAAVLAADDDWLAAERRGDVAALDARLADGYRDIEADGKAHSKAELLAYTARRPDKSTAPAGQVAREFRAAHPITERVLIVGDTAVLSFHSVESTQQDAVRSVDVFAYRNGMWRGVLSDHAIAPKAK